MTLARDVLATRAGVAAGAAEDRECALELSGGAAADDDPVPQFERVQLEPLAVCRVRPAADREASRVELADRRALLLVDQIAALADPLAFCGKLAQPALDRAPMASGGRLAVCASWRSATSLTSVPTHRSDRGSVSSI